MNIILNTDSYKVSHWKQYPPKTQYISSYIEARGGDYGQTLFYGLQMFLKELKPITRQDISEGEEIWTAHGFEFNREGWEYILNTHGGNLPLNIQALPEGMIVPIKNCLVQVVNTDPNCYWLTSYLETSLLRAVWYPSTVATRSWRIKKIIRKFLEETGCEDVGGILPFRLHDFGARGVSSNESAGLGGSAHLVNFMGSDTMTANLYARKYYGEPMAGFSIPAAEHSTITSWGKEKESLAYMNMIKQFDGPNKLVAVVSDSYNIYDAVEHIWGEELKEFVGNMRGTLVIRPDSGNPTQVPVDVVVKLGEKFGFTVNKAGYKVLPKFVRVIQGDGINENSIWDILRNLKNLGWAAENIAFGMGGELLQTMNRDTQKWAMKASAIKLDDNEWKEISKSPITDMGKISKAGRLAVVSNNGQVTTVPEKGASNNLLVDVWQNGKLLVDHKFSEIRERSNIDFREA